MLTRYPCEHCRASQCVNGLSAHWKKEQHKRNKKALMESSRLLQELADDLY